MRLNGFSLQALVIIVSTIKLHAALCLINNGSSWWTTATLTEARSELAATSVGHLALFAGGKTASWSASAVVDIYNATDGSWTTASLTQARWGLVATSVGTMALFAGGYDGGALSAVVDIYNATDGSWTTASLTQARWLFAATSVGNIALFAGGYATEGQSMVVDIYNAIDGSWTTANLTQARDYLSATSVSNTMALFAGGYATGNVESAVVDIYNVTDGSWTTASLSEARAGPVAASVGNVALFATGGDVASKVGVWPGDVVDIYNVIDGSWTTASLSEPRRFPAATSLGDLALFAGGDNWDSGLRAMVDIYNATDGSWTTANLTQARSELAATLVGDTALFAGGYSPEGASAVVDMCRIPAASTSDSAIGVPLLFLSGFGADVLLIRKDGKDILRPEEAVRVNFGTTITEVDSNDGSVMGVSSFNPNRGFVTVEPEQTGYADAAESFLFSTGLRSSENDTSLRYENGTMQVQFYLFRNRTDLPLFGGNFSLPVDPSFAKFTVRVSDWPWRAQSNSSLVLRVKVAPPFTTFTRRTDSPAPGITTFALGGQFSSTANSRAGTEIRLANVVEVDGKLVTDNAVAFDLDLSTSELVLTFSRRFNSTLVYDPDLGVLFGQAESVDDEVPLATIIGASVAGFAALVLVALVITAILAVAWLRRKRARSASTRTQVNFDYDDEEDTRLRKTSRAPPSVTDGFLMGDPF